VPVPPLNRRHRVLGFPIAANAQDTAYALNTKCWERQPTGDGTYSFRMLTPAAKECLDGNGIMVPTVSMVEVYTKGATDDKVSAPQN